MNTRAEISKQIEQVGAAMKEAAGSGDLSGVNLVLNSGIFDIMVEIACQMADFNQQFKEFRSGYAQAEGWNE